MGCVCKLFGWAKDCFQFWTPFGTTVIVLWLFYRPDRFHPFVDSGVLTTLNSTSPANATGHDRPSLQYDLTLNVSLRNSHRRLSMRYLDIGATAFYNGTTMLGPAEDAFPTPFRQGPKNTTPTFEGTVAVDPSVAAELEREIAVGTVHLRVRVSLMFMYKVWPMKEVFFFDYDCWLWFPPPRDGVPAVFDAGTRCWAVKQSLGV
nr:unnamed protein product [Digitaria exilis]